MFNGPQAAVLSQWKDYCPRRTDTMRDQAKQDNHQGMDWNRIFGSLLILAGAIGSATALLYVWTIQMMLRYARHDLSQGIWVFLICLAVLLVSLIVGYLGVRLWKRRVV
jgi:hypothetical protein